MSQNSKVDFIRKPVVDYKGNSRFSPRPQSLHHNNNSQVRVMDSLAGNVGHHASSYILFDLD